MLKILGKIQVYDEDLDDYVDLEPQSNVENKAKIKLARKVVPQADCTSPNGILADVTASTLRNDNIAGSSATTSGFQQEQAVPLEKQLDYLEFTLPGFGPYDEVLKKKTPIGSAVRRALVNRIFQACFRIAWYPSRQLYRVAAERLVSKYPHLADRIGSSSGLDSWVLALRNKFKNMRKKVENCSVGMMAKKRRSLHKRQREAPAEEEPNKRLCRLFECSHLVVYGETAESIQKHNAWLQENAACQDEAQMRPRLLATAQERHQRLRSLPLYEALLLYPFLGTETSLLMEFDMLFKKKAVESIENGCRELCSIVLQCGEEAEVAELSQVACQDAVLAVLQFVASRCKEPLDALLTENEIPLTPCLVKAADGTVSLWIDRQLVFTVSSLLSGVACLFAAYWVFHIEYAKKAHRMLTFIEHAFFGLCHTKPRVKALELINFHKANASCVAQVVCTSSQ